LSDELKGSFYAVVETPSGRAYLKIIAEKARSAGGVYVLDPASDVSGNSGARRLRELERLGLATVDGANRWRVSPNLSEELERRAARLPARHRLLLHKEPRALENQVGHGGPVWLDRIKVAELAPYGFGAEVRRAVDRRREVLLKFGIQPDDPTSVSKLRDLEHDCVVRQFATRSGQVHLPSIPDGFRGRLQMIDPQAPSGSPGFAVVSDGSRFVLVRAATSDRASVGRTVTVTRDGKGRAVVRPAEDKDLGR
jgi:hypothetical protein